MFASLVIQPYRPQDGANVDDERLLQLVVPSRPLRILHLLVEGLGEHEGRDDVDVEAVVHHLGLDAGEAGQVGDAAVVDQATQAEGGGQRLKCVPIRFM